MKNGVYDGRFIYYFEDHFKIQGTVYPLEEGEKPESLECSECSGEIMEPSDACVTPFIAVGKWKFNYYQRKNLLHKVTRKRYSKRFTIYLANSFLY